MAQSGKSSQQKSAETRAESYRLTEEYATIRAAIFNGARRTPAVIAKDLNVGLKKVRTVIADLKRQNIDIPEPDKSVGIAKAVVARKIRFRESEQYQNIYAAIFDGQNRSAYVIAAAMDIRAANVYAVMADLKERGIDLPVVSRAPSATIPVIPRSKELTAKAVVSRKEAYRNSNDYQRICSAVREAETPVVALIAAQLKVSRARVYAVIRDMKEQAIAMPNLGRKSRRGVDREKYRRTDDYRRIRDAILANERPSAPQIARQLGVSNDRVYRVVDDLIEQAIKSSRVRLSRTKVELNPVNKVVSRRNAPRPALTAAATAAAHAEFRASQIYADIAKALEEPTAYPVPVARQLGVTNNQVALVILDMERAELKTASANGDVKTITQAKKVHPNIRFAARKALQVTTARPQIRAQLNKIIKDRFRARKEYALVVKALTEKNRSRRFEIMSEYKVSSNFITRVARDLREQGKTINNRKPGPPKGTPSPKKGRRFSPGG